MAKKPSIPGVAETAPPAPTLHSADTPPKPGFNFGTFLADARKDEEAALLAPGRYNLAISDARVGAEPNDRGLFYAVVICVSGDVEIPLILALDLSDDLKGEDGMPDAAKLADDPIARKQFLAGLSQLEQLQKACGITGAELAECTSADDAITLFIGGRFKAIIARGKDQYALPCNTIRKILGKADG